MSYVIEIDVRTGGRLNVEAMIVSNKTKCLLLDITEYLLVITD